MLEVVPYPIVLVRRIETRNKATIPTLNMRMLHVQHFSLFMVHIFFSRTKRVDYLMSWVSLFTSSYMRCLNPPYRQMFLPVLKFLLALLTCPGPQQREASTQVTALIGAHSDLFATILRDHVHHISIATLHELALVTALISRSGIGKKHQWFEVAVSDKDRL